VERGRSGEGGNRYEYRVGSVRGGGGNASNTHTWKHVVSGRNDGRQHSRFVDLATSLRTRTWGEEVKRDWFELAMLAGAIACACIAAFAPLSRLAMLFLGIVAVTGIATTLFLRWWVSIIDPIDSRDEQ
jgi:hypothetical protein